MFSQRTSKVLVVYGTDTNKYGVVCGVYLAKTLIARSHSIFFFIYLLFSQGFSVASAAKCIFTIIGVGKKMKTTKNISSTRRSLRNASNGTKTAGPKSDKASADPAKAATKVKGKVGKGPQNTPPAKSVPQVSKRKREYEEKNEELDDKNSASPTSEEVTKPSSNADQDETLIRPKVRRQRKKKENQPSEEESWHTLDDFNSDKATDDIKKKVLNTGKGGDRRKQSLVERDIPCAVMVRSKPRVSAPQDNDNDSDCEVLDSGNSGAEGEHTIRNAGLVHMDVDDLHSETGSNFCEIIEEGSTLLDFKKLHALARRVNLPSTIWACHVDPLSHFVSFSRFNPDFSESGSNLVDRAVVFKGSMKPLVFCNGETTLLPEEINTFETLTDVAQALQHLNAMILP